MNIETSGNASSRAPRLRLSILTTGFIVSVAFVVLGSVVSVMEVSRAQEEVLQTFRTGERTTYLLGHIGKQIARAQLVIGEGASEDPPSDLPTWADETRFDAAVVAAANELEPLLSPQERAVWSELKPKLARLRGELDRARHALERADPDRADRILRDVVPLSIEVNEQLSRLADRNRSEIAGVLDAAQARLGFVKLVEAIIGGVLLLAIAAAWALAIRTIRHQRREVDDFVLRIEAANRDLDAFAGRIAHDLRNVFGPIVVAADTLELASSKPQTVESIGHGLQRASARGMAILDELLAFSRAGSPSDATSSVRDGIRACIEQLRPLADRVGATINVEVTGEPRARISAPLLQIVIANLVGNAVKFLEGRERREVWIRARSDQARCVVVVEDTGPGIPEASLPKLFEPFYRVPGTSAPGTGIGLATVHRIIHAHRGRIVVTSKTGEGARFEIGLPAAPTDDPSSGQGLP